MVKNWIYSVTNPLDNGVLYVGRTNNYYLRWGNHFSCKGSNPRLNSVISQLLAVGLEPIFNILECCPEEQAYDMEKKWIKFHLDNGHKLLNRIAGYNYKPILHGPTTLM